MTMRKRTNKKPQTKPDPKIDPKGGRTWLAEPYVQMRIAYNIRGFGAAARRAFREEVDACCEKLDPGRRTFMNTGYL